MHSFEQIMTKENLLELGLENEVSNAIYTKYELLRREYPTMNKLQIGFGHLVRETIDDHRELQKLVNHGLVTMAFHAKSTPVVIQFHYTTEEGGNEND